MNSAQVRSLTFGFGVSADVVSPILEAAKGFVWTMANGKLYQKMCVDIVSGVVAAAVSYPCLWLTTGLFSLSLCVCVVTVGVCCSVNCRSPPFSDVSCANDIFRSSRGSKWWWWRRRRRK